MRDLALHLLDLAQNSLAAGATHLWLTVVVDVETDRLSLAIRDDGRGIPRARLDRVTDPFVTTRTTRHVGLGLPLIKAAAERCGGWLTISSVEGEGTTVGAEFRLRHVDRAPLGNLAETVIGLVACNPELELILRAEWNHNVFAFTTAACREILGPESSLADPAVLGYLREYLADGLTDLQRTEEAAAGLEWRKT